VCGSSFELVEQARPKGVSLVGEGGRRRSRRGQPSSSGTQQRGPVGGEEVHPTAPPRVDYALTDLGRTLLEPVAALEVWAKAHRGHILTARESYDSRTV
jgi:hypothetical protein